MKTCCICGQGYTSEGDILIYGCRKCHKGLWLINSRSLGVALDSPYKRLNRLKTIYGKSSSDVKEFVS